jgi:hypothetical protein
MNTLVWHVADPGIEAYIYYRNFLGYITKDIMVRASAFK